MIFSFILLINKILLTISQKNYNLKQTKKTEMLKLSLLLLVSFLLLIPNYSCGPISGAICSAGCAAVVVACYSAGGLVFGTGNIILTSIANFSTNLKLLFFK